MYNQGPYILGVGVSLKRRLQLPAKTQTLGDSNSGSTLLVVTGLVVAATAVVNFNSTKLNLLQVGFCTDVGRRHQFACETHVAVNCQRLVCLVCVDPHTALNAYASLHRLAQLASNCSTKRALHGCRITMPHAYP